MFSFKESQVERAMHHSLSEIALKSGFKFRDIENRRLDWKTLGCVDVNKVIENQDFEFLEKITPKIIEAPMQSILGTAALDPAVSSLFRLAQMSLQYLSFCQQFMSHTLYDLRTAFNQLQKKYSNLKQNYKCLEEQHYKAQERIQCLLKENKGEINRVSKPSSLFPCDQCTKNFLTADSLKSHVQRKHSEEKHESSDENEKDKDKEKENGFDKEENNGDKKNNDENAVTQQQESDSKFEDSQLNNNNNDGENSANCTTCSEKSNINSSTKAVQCEVTKSESQAVPNDHEKSKENENLAKNVESELSHMLPSEMAQNAYQTISELKKEIVELKKSLEAKINLGLQSDDSPNNGNLPSNDKIDVIEQKFNAFEMMYTNSQHQFIESFRSLDERQKVYMDNIQETIKEIVEKSLGQQHFDGNAKQPENHPLTENYKSNETDTDEMNQNEDEDDIENKSQNHNNDHVELPSENHSRPKVMPRKMHQIQPIESTSQSEDEEKKIVCEVEVHSDLNGREQKAKKRTKHKSSDSSDNKITKDMAIDEFEQRLRQFGVDADSTGLNTPRSCEVYQDIAEEREEMKKANKSFEKTRKKLRNEVDRIAKKKLTSASSVTSLSSTPYQSDEALEQFDSKSIQISKNRPKSASVEKMRKRNAKKLMQKFVKNDIDENDIIDKMQMAQKALNAHRECIQELLQTTAHSPSSLTKIKYSTSNASKDKDSISNQNVENSDANSNQYNKMPNITTRRVVFVNLDEDS